MLRARDLTHGERLLIVRRREGSTAADCAVGCGVSLYRYKRWEQDLERGPSCAVGRLAAHEGALVLRRRAGISVADLAAALDVSPYWLSRLERGLAPPERLEAYWRDAIGV